MKNIYLINKGSIVLCLLCLASGCAFDISYVRKVPATFTPTTDNAQDFILNQDVSVGLGTGYPTQIKDGTHWRRVGVTEYGTVFATKDQIVTVEASDIYEAQLIVSNQCITGFYLPVEKEVAPVSHPMHIEIQPTNNQ